MRRCCVLLHFIGLAGDTAQPCLTSLAPKSNKIFQKLHKITRQMLTHHLQLQRIYWKPIMTEGSKTYAVKWVIKR